jgi:polysaccharide export outer membrane protein
MLRSALLALLAILVVNTLTVQLARADAPYRVNPGDVLEVFIWNEKELTREVLVRPDGLISVPLAGQIAAGGRTVPEIETALTEVLTRFLKDKPTVTVSLRQSNGYRIYVLGKVNRPGEYPIARPTDIMQALALAGGLNAFAAENDVIVLHRDAAGAQKSTRFRYSDVKSGDALDTNTVLQAGDVVVVP